MRLGLVTDIHNHAPELAVALRLFRERSVDQVVVIGDTCDAFSRHEGAAEVTALLEECGAVGVWGNHDFSLCRHVTDAARRRYPPAVLEVMSRMEPRLIVGDCHFSHRESSVDPHDPAQLWDLNEQALPLMQLAGLAFGAVAQRLQFVGHYHRWAAAKPDGPVDWNGAEPLCLEPTRRYFVIVAAVCDGWCAILDAGLGLLEPHRCSTA